MTGHSVTLRFSDGVERNIEADEATTVLDAATAADVPLVSQCRSGSCGTCVARRRGGDLVMADGRALALLPAEVEAGDRLTCSTYVRSDAAFELPYPSSLLFDPGPRSVDGTVAEVVRVSDSVVRLSVEVAPGAAALTFRPGQYMRVRVPGTDEWRSYSMATTEAALPRIDFLVRMFPGGVMTSYLLQRASVGDPVQLEGPMGSFFLHADAAPHLLVAGGSGLAPMIAMLDAMRAARGPVPRTLLCFACSTEGGLFYLDELELRAFWMPSLEVRIAVSRPTDPSYGGAVATPVGLLGDADLAVAELVAYLCGPPGMVVAARQRLLQAGVRDDRIHAEQFRESGS